MSLDIVKEELRKSEIIQYGTEQQYFLSGLCDGVPYIDPLLLNEISNHILQNFDLMNVDRIVCVEAMGIPIATTLSLKTKIPFTIIRKKKYNLQNEYELIQNTSYKKDKKLYINGIAPNTNILLIDDVISTGGTIGEIIKSLECLGANIKHTIIMVEVRNDYDKSDIDYTSLIKIKIKDKKVWVD